MRHIRFIGEGATIIRGRANNALLEPEEYVNIGLKLGALVGSYCTEAGVTNHRLITVIGDQTSELSLTALYRDSTVRRAEPLSPAKDAGDQKGADNDTGMKEGQESIFVELNRQAHDIALRVADLNEISLSQLVAVGMELHPVMYTTVVAGGTTFVEHGAVRADITGYAARILQVEDLGVYYQQ